MQINKEPKIKVGIVCNEHIDFELCGEYSCNEVIIAPGKYSATIANNEVLTPFQQSAYIFLVPKKRSTFLIKRVTIGIDFHWEKSEDQLFEGTLILLATNKGVQVINEIFLENYLTSVISSEMSAMNDLTLLKAHAIVSRSWLLAQIQNSVKKEIGSNSGGTLIQQNSNLPNEIIKWYDREDHLLFDVCADDHCQRYQGISKVVSNNAKNAVEATRGIILSFNNEICDARFSKCCGGLTEDFENVWQPIKIPYLTAVRDWGSSKANNNLTFNDEFFITKPDAFCNTNDKYILQQVLVDFDRRTSDFFRWKVEYTHDELKALLEKKSGCRFGNIIDLVPVERGKSGRIIRLEIVGTRQTITVGKELEIRKWLSESHLYSSAFCVEKIFNTKTNYPEKFILYGAGWGHGVGMCQIGAAVMSKTGYSVNQILEHYFKQTRLKKLYSH